MGFYDVRPLTYEEQGRKIERLNLTLHAYKEALKKIAARMKHMKHERVDCGCPAHLAEAALEAATHIRERDNLK